MARNKIKRNDVSTDSDENKSKAPALREMYGDKYQHAKGVRTRGGRKDFETARNHFLRKKGEKTGNPELDDATTSEQQEEDDVEHKKETIADLFSRLDSQSRLSQSAVKTIEDIVAADLKHELNTDAAGQIHRILMDPARARKPLPKPGEIRLYRGKVSDGEWDEYLLAHWKPWLDGKSATRKDVRDYDPRLSTRMEWWLCTQNDGKMPDHINLPTVHERYLMEESENAELGDVSAREYRRRVQRDYRKRKKDKPATPEL